MKLSIVLPCHNEEQAIDHVMDQFERVAPIISKGLAADWEIVAVDDGSTDRTVSLLEIYARKIPQLRVLKLPRRQGYGGALKAGFGSARGEVLAFMDMDDTYQLEDLWELYLMLVRESLAMVSGDRLTRLEDMPWTRTLGNRIFVETTKRLFNKEVKDCCSGMRVFRRDYIEAFSTLFPNGLNFTLSMTLVFLQMGLPFKEIPISYKSRKGQSKLSLLLDGPTFFLTIFRYFYLCRFHPGFRMKVRQLLSMETS